MGRSLFLGGVTVVAVAGLWAASVAVPAEAATYRAMSTGQISDPTGDALGLRPVPVQEPRADLTGAKAIVLGDGRIELTATVAQPTDPATDAGWNDGRSYVIWGIDTTADGTADYLVWMAASPPTLAAIVITDRLQAIDGCNPVAGYSPAGYAVVISGSCIGTPATFGWNAIVYYDMNHDDDGNGAMDTLLSEDDMSLAPGTTSDPAGDVISKRDANDPRADITSATIAYQPGRIDLTATLDRPTDPRLDPVWVEGAEVGWSFDTDGDDEPNYVAALGASPDLTVTVYDRNGGNSAIRCTALATYTPTGYSVTLDPACIGSPARLWWGVGTMFDQDRQAAIDSAPDFSMAGPVTSTTDPQARPAGSDRHSGYWMITSRGDVFAFGEARPLGGGEPCCGAMRVDIEPTRSGNGYWILDAFGAVIPKGDARDLGGASGLQPGERAAALSATPSGNGYWIFTDRGRVLPFGDAPFLGDMTGVALNGGVLDSVATPTGKGYWMVASDGGIFSFGDATFSGSMGGTRLNEPVMSMAADPDGKGYWLVASDGGIFAFDASFYGSMGATRLNKPISGIVPGNAGYLMVGEDGGIFAFGNVAFHGSLGANPPASPVVAVALAPTPN